MKEFMLVLTETGQEARCLYLFYLDESIKFASQDRHDLKYTTFHHDKDKNLLYSHNYSYNGKKYDFIYKLSHEIQKCSNEFI